MIAIITTTVVVVIIIVATATVVLVVVVVVVVGGCTWCVTHTEGVCVFVADVRYQVVQLVVLPFYVWIPPGQ